MFYKRVPVLFVLLTHTRMHIHVKATKDIFMLLNNSWGQLSAKKCSNLLARAVKKTIS